jgi:hypothetical protein
MKERLDSKAQIYAVFWRCEELLEMLWKVVADNLLKKLSFFNFEDFLLNLETLVTSKEQYKDPGINYLPKEVFMESLLHVFYQMFYPREESINRWRSSVEQTFSQLVKIG